MQNSYHSPDDDEPLLSLSQVQHAAGRGISGVQNLAGQGIDRVHLYAGNTIDGVQNIAGQTVSRFRRELRARTGFNELEGIDDGISTFQRYIHLLVLVLLNMCNFADRVSIVPLMEVLQKDFDANDKDLGALNSAFIISFMSLSLVFGYLGDRKSRKLIICFGGIIWQAAIGTSGMLQPNMGNKNTQWNILLACRAFYGVGEAAYANVAQPIIFDLFPSPEGRIFGFALYAIAMPVGAGVGSVMSAHLLQITESWQWAIVSPSFITIPVLLFYIMFVDDVPHKVQRVGGDGAKGLWSDIKTLASRKTMFGIVGGVTCINFSVTTFTNWASVFVYRLIDLKGYTPGYAKEVKTMTMETFGAFTIITGVLGGYLGGCLAAWLRKKFNYGRAESDISATALMIAAINCYVFVAPTDKNTGLAFLKALHFVTLLVGALTWPVFPVMIFSVVLPSQKSIAQGVVNTVSHVLGDAFAPALIGFISDSNCARYPNEKSRHSPLHKFMCLKSALLCVPVVLAVGSAFFFYASHYIERDTATNELETKREEEKRLEALRIEAAQANRLRHVTE